MRLMKYFLRFYYYYHQINLNMLLLLLCSMFQFRYSKYGTFFPPTQWLSCYRRFSTNCFNGSHKWSRFCEFNVSKTKRNHRLLIIIQSEWTEIISNFISKFIHNKGTWFIHKLCSCCLRNAAFTGTFLLYFIISTFICFS